MRYPQPVARPGIATLFGLISVCWALTTLAGTLVMLLVVFVGSTLAWLLGPVAGLAGTALGSLIALYLVTASGLSFLLLSAGWQTLQGDPRGVRQLRLWAWLSLILDALTLLFTLGHAALGYFGVGFALAVLYFTTPSEIRMRWIPEPGQRPWAGHPKSDPDPDF